MFWRRVCDDLSVSFYLHLFTWHSDPVRKHNMRYTLPATGQCCSASERGTLATDFNRSWKTFIIFLSCTHFNVPLHSFGSAGNWQMLNFLSSLLVHSSQVNTKWHTPIRIFLFSNSETSNSWSLHTHTHTR